jgi:uroporphyrinogen-III synthase
MLRVLVTRPEPGASRTASKLKERGFEPVLLPLSATAALPVELDALPKEVAAVAVTSANAVRHAPAALIAALAGLPCRAVGERTAQAARTAGFLSVEAGPGDAAALAGDVASSFAGKTIVYLCGRVRLPLFEQRLGAARVRVDPVETYDTVALTWPDEEVAARLAGLPVEAALLYSTKAAGGMRALSARAALAHLFAKTAYFALSGRVAAAFASDAERKIKIATTPDEPALLALLSSRR